MRKTQINHKPQVHARVCKENEEENKENNDCWLKYFAVKGSTLKGCRRTEMLPIQAKLITRIVQNIKILVQ